MELRKDLYTKNRENEYFFLSRKTLSATFASGLSLLIGFVMFMMYISPFNINQETRIIFLVISILGLISSILVLWRDAYFYIKNIKLKNIHLRSQTKYTYYWIFLSGLFFPIYYFYMSKNVVFNSLLRKAFYLEGRNQFIKLEGTSKYTVKKLSHYKEFFKLDIADITISGLLLGLYLIVLFATKSSGLGGLSFEYLFYIVAAYFLRYFKAALLAFLADLFGLLISGTIGTWHWVYGLVPIAATLVLSLFFDLFEKNKKAGVILSNVVLWGVLVALFAIFIWQTSSSEANAIRISRTFGYRQLSITTFIVLAFLTAIIVAVMSALSFRYLTSKSDSKAKESILILLIAFVSVVLVIVVFRWIWGPFAYIRWQTWQNPKSKALANGYVFYMLPIVFRSVITIPVYTLVLSAIMVPLIYLRTKYIEKKVVGKY
ncbi:hypothetical protein [Mycoplasmopsis columboralis]|uniref:Uncharacterized protein n=1 Tax=Mycoplasmopsis columboralis TaxID=171282 RepID=A0A449B697_9BACT|nr:hypothetical protein [Mycoplasmopsis columboralis]VEU76072.1 Uncharacterised protein [Mycoplasmopsis columboralis]